MWKSEPQDCSSKQEFMPTAGAMLNLGINEADFKTVLICLLVFQPQRTESKRSQQNVDQMRHQSSATLQRQERTRAGPSSNEIVQQEDFSPHWVTSIISLVCGPQGELGSHRTGPSGHQTL